MNRPSISGDEEDRDSARLLGCWLRPRGGKNENETHLVILPINFSIE
jgi:hypothetical protein